MFFPLIKNSMLVVSKSERAKVNHATSGRKQNVPSRFVTIEMKK